MRYALFLSLFILSLFAQGQMVRCGNTPRYYSRPTVDFIVEMEDNTRVSYDYANVKTNILSNSIEYLKCDSFEVRRSFTFTAELIDVRRYVLTSDSVFVDKNRNLSFWDRVVRRTKCTSTFTSSSTENVFRSVASKYGRIYSTSETTIAYYPDSTLHYISYIIKEDWLFYREFTEFDRSGALISRSVSDSGETYLEEIDYALVDRRANGNYIIQKTSFASYEDTIELDTILLELTASGEKVQVLDESFKRDSLYQMNFTLNDGTDSTTNLWYYKSRDEGVFHWKLGGTYFYVDGLLIKANVQSTSGADPYSVTYYYDDQRRCVQVTTSLYAAEGKERLRFKARYDDQGRVVYKSNGLVDESYTYW